MLAILHPLFLLGASILLLMGPAMVPVHSADSLCHRPCACHSNHLTEDGSQGALAGKCICTANEVLPEAAVDFVKFELDFSEAFILKSAYLPRFSQIRYLNISGLQFVEPGGFYGMENVHYLIMDKNYMRVLERQMFDGLTNLNRLIIEATEEHKIHALENGSFLGLVQLHYLQLRGNAIQVIKGEYFQDLGELLELDLSHNLLTHVLAETFINMPKLTKLLLNYNLIKTVQTYAYIGLTQLKSLELINNSIETMPEPVFSHLTGTPQSINLLLDENPLRCYCKLNWISAWLDTKHHEIEGMCVKPKEHENELLKTVYKESFPECHDNNTIIKAMLKKSFQVNCPIVDASWLVPGNAAFQEHGDCQGGLCLANTGALVIWSASPENEGDYVCTSLDTDEHYVYHMSISEDVPALSPGEITGIAVGLFLLVLLTIVVSIAKLKNSPPTSLMGPNGDDRDPLTERVEPPDTADGIVPVDPEPASPGQSGARPKEVMGAVGLGIAKGIRAIYKSGTANDKVNLNISTA